MAKLQLLDLVFNLECSQAILEIVKANLVRLPDIIISDGLSSQVDYSIQVVPEGNVFDLDDHRFRVSETSDTATFGKDLVLFIGKKLQACLESRNVYSLHASAVSHQGIAVAFTGRSGSGKSTLALALADAEVAQLSANHLLIQLDGQVPTIVGGCRFARLRQGSILHDLPWLSSSLPANRTNEGDDPWHSYAQIQLQDITGAPRQFPCQLAELILPTRVPQALRLAHHNPDELADILFTEVSIFLRPSFFKSHLRLIPCFDTDQFVRSRYLFIQNLIRKIPVYSLSGELFAMADHIRGRPYWKGLAQA